MPSNPRRFLFMDIPFIIIQSVAIFFHFFGAEMKSLVCGLTRPKRRRRRTLFYVLAGVCGIYFLSIITVDPRYTFTNTNTHSACILPDLNPWDKSILQFDWHPEPLACDPTISIVFIDSMGRLQFNKSAIKEQHLDKLSCKYSEIIRPHLDDDYIRLSTEKELTRPVTIKSDFVQVKCTDNNKLIFDKILLQASIFHNEREILPESGNQYSVFMFGVDAVSRLAGIRKIPLTYKYLKEELHALEFKGHMKTGDNTFPNLISILTGKEPFSSELPPVNGPFDTYPFLWNNFSQTSYATYFSEDSPEMHTFNLGKKGFKKQPTNHYMRPFWRAVKKTDLVSTLLDDAFIGLEANKINVRKKSSLCYGNTPKHMLTVQFHKDFIQKYNKKRRFSLSWLNSLSHNYVNFLELGDNDFKDFMKWIHTEGHLENAFLLFMSDHGSRIDAIRNTYVGRIEERMPLLLMVPPKSLKPKFPKTYENLKENTQKLTSHYDIYKTLVDILKNNIPSNEASNSRGISLLTKIPNDRSCSDAGVPEEYCSCYSPQPIPVNTPKVEKLSKFVVNQINLLLKPEGDKCAILSIKEVTDAQEISLDLKHTGGVEFFSIWKYFKEPEKEKELRYLILIQTTPGDGLFEATVKVDSEGNISLFGVPSRTNKYGDQSACISDHIRRNFCYCNNLLNPQV